MNLYNDIINKKEKISVVGLGYVGIPLAVEFAKHVNVIGFDINEEKVNSYINGVDSTKEVGDYEIKNTTVEFTLYNDIINKKEKISVVGLGYVGIPLAVEFAKHVNVIGFDINEEKVNSYINGVDSTKEVGDYEIKNTTVEFTCDESKLKEAKFHIVAVPTPINSDKTPDLKPVIGATKSVARNLTKGSIVVYESTVYPGTTEDI